MLSVIILSVILSVNILSVMLSVMLSVITLNVDMLSVEGPFENNFKSYLKML
jgi:hypothetical protein